MAFSPALAHSLANARQDVFWTDRPELRPTPRPALTGHGGRADLVIVGGGFTGLWAAIQAKEDDPSRDVVLLEAGRLGIGASGRNGGFVSPSLTHGLAQGVAQWPDEIATLERLASENFAGWQATLRDKLGPSAFAQIKVESVQDANGSINDFADASGNILARTVRVSVTVNWAEVPIEKLRK